MSEKMTTSEPTTGEIVRKLEMLLPPMTNYAESVCAEGAFAHSTHMVWDDPEPYIIKNAIDRLKSQEQTIAALTARAEQAEKERDIWERKWWEEARKKVEAQVFKEKAERERDAAIKDISRLYWTRRGLPQEGEGD